jgi:hypothetical protein
MTKKAAAASRQGVRRIPKARQFTVRREDINRLIDVFNERGALLERLIGDIQHLRHDLEIQFQRIAQLQAELDRLKKQ